MGGFYKQKLLGQNEGEKNTKEKILPACVLLYVLRVIGGFLGIWGNFMDFFLCIFSNQRKPLIALAKSFFFFASGSVRQWERVARKKKKNQII